MNNDHNHVYIWYSAISLDFLCFIVTTGCWNFGTMNKKRLINVHKNQRTNNTIAKTKNWLTILDI